MIRGKAIDRALSHGRMSRELQTEIEREARPANEWDEYDPRLNERERERERESESIYPSIASECILT